LKKYENTKNRELKAIFVSSVLFGAYHLINIFYGASVPQTILQFFYTVPIGAMMCLVYLVSGKLVFGVLIHGIYSFAGDLVSVIGIKDQWNTPEVILTAAVSFAVFVIYLGFFASKTKK
jgi:membrane protease YdiL (CAAX protease family)